MSCDEYATWEAYFAEAPWPGEALLDAVASVPAFLESAWTRKQVGISKHRIRYERPKSGEELAEESNRKIGAFVNWSL